MLGLDPGNGYAEWFGACGTVKGLTATPATPDVPAYHGRYDSIVTIHVDSWYAGPQESDFFALRNRTFLRAEQKCGGQDGPGFDKWAAEGDILRPGDHVLFVAFRKHERFARVGSSPDHTPILAGAWHLRQGSHDKDQVLLRQLGISYDAPEDRSLIELREDMGAIELIFENAEFTLQEAIDDLRRFNAE